MPFQTASALHWVCILLPILFHLDCNYKLPLIIPNLTFETFVPYSFPRISGKNGTSPHVTKSRFWSSVDTGTTRFGAETKHPNTFMTHDFQRSENLWSFFLHHLGSTLTRTSSPWNDLIFRCSAAPWWSTLRCFGGEC